MSNPLYSDPNFNQPPWYTAPDNAGITDIKDASIGKWVVNPATNTLTLYRVDGVTVLKTFTLGTTGATVPTYISRTPQ